MERSQPEATYTLGRCTKSALGGGIYQMQTDDKRRQEIWIFAIAMLLTLTDYQTNGMKTGNSSQLSAGVRAP